MLKNVPKKLIFLILGHFFVILGFIGLFLPILPTTPFLLLSTYFYSRSSKKFHNWLITHPIFGDLISDWEKYGVISKKSKLISSIFITLFFSYTLIFVDVNIYIKVTVALTGIAVMTFILTRPSNKNIT